MPQPTVQQTLQDPKFYGLPPAEQQKVLATLDPNYARLPLQERNKVLQMGQQRLSATPAVDASAAALPPLPKPPSLQDRYNAATAPYTESTPTSSASAATVADMGVNGMTPAKFLKATGQEFGAALGNVGAGAMGMILHPIDTAKAAVAPLRAMLPAYANGPGGIPIPVPNPDLLPFANRTTRSIAADPLATLEAGAGQAAVAEAVPGVVRGAGNVVEGGVRRLAGSGPGIARDLVRDLTKENRGIDLNNAKVKDANEAAENTLDLRRQHEQDYQQATAEHYAKESAADTRAKAEENTAWSAWRQKTAGKTLDGGQIIGPLGKLRLDSPEVDRTLNQLEPRGDEVPQESPYAQIRERTAQQQYGRDYEGLSPVKQDEVDDLLHNNGYSPEPIAFDPQAGQPISIDRVQRASSILQRYIRSGRFEGPLLGEMKQVAKVLRNAVTRASADAGASPELEGARTATITYQDAFGRERRLPATARTVREQQINPTAYKERLDEERLAKARRYDPTLVDSYRRVKAARQTLKAFPTEDQLRKGLQQPSLKRTASMDQLQQANEDSVRKRVGNLGQHAFWWTGVWPGFRILSALVHGQEFSLQPLALMPAAGAAGIAIEHILAHPPVMDFLTRATRQQVAQIPPDLRGAMPDIVNLAGKRGVRVSPILAAYAATIQRNQGQRQGAAQ